MWAKPGIVCAPITIITTKTDDHDHLYRDQHIKSEHNLQVTTQCSPRSVSTKGLASNLIVVPGVLGKNHTRGSDEKIVLRVLGKTDRSGQQLL